MPTDEEQVLEAHAAFYDAFSERLALDELLARLDAAVDVDELFGGAR